jgi:hypothetical protein
MELILGLIVLAVVGYALYYYNTRDKNQANTAPTVNRYTGETAEAPYKVEPPAPTPSLEAATAAVIPTVAVAIPELVNPQITDSVTQTPAKKPRKPRAVKAEKPAKEKAAGKKPAAIKAKAKTTKSKKA